MATALVSLLSGRLVKPGVGMTGEITLRGQVLPIGGVKEKVLAGHRNGLKTIILPKRNEPDLEDVPEEIKKSMQFVFAESVDEVIAAALEPAADVPVADAPVAVEPNLPDAAELQEDKPKKKNKKTKPKESNHA
jgi:ATP-dependent Lon protease